MDAILVDSISPLRPSLAARKISKSSSSPQFSRTKSPSSPTTPLRVLVVDDNKLQRQIHKRMVEQAGFKCDVAESGEQAIAMAQDMTYHLVLMDLMMTGRDGWSTARKIRKNSLSGASGALVGAVRPRIVAVTGMHIDNKLIKECADAGMDDIIHKPVSPPILNKLLSSFPSE